ncbi:MAG TPA: thioesterase family protein [Phenylobacterium sp.]
MTSFLRIEATDDRLLWRLPLTPAVCVGPPDNLFMYGGVGLGSAIHALEGATGRPVIWATAQYLSYARPGSTVDLHVTVSVQGRRTSQARVIGRVGEEEIFVVAAALGGQGGGPSYQWVEPPQMPGPDDCATSELWPDQGANLNGRIELRMAQGRFGEGPRDGTISDDGRLVFWIRTREGFDLDASLLAVFADYVPSGVGAALGRPGGGSSLDNTLRIRTVTPTEWVLCDVQIKTVHGGIAHGAMNLFSQGGEFLATASQSMIVRTL